MDLILSSTDGERTESALTIWCRYGTEYGGFSKSRCGYGFRTRTCTPEYGKKYLYVDKVKRAEARKYRGA